MQSTKDTLRGIVALVDVGAETRALPLRCALAALGATVVTEWKPLVTHLVWTDSKFLNLNDKSRSSPFTCLISDQKDHFQTLS